MRWQLILGAMGLCVGLSGCRLASDITQNACFETRLFVLDVKAKVYYPHLARAAWDAYRAEHPEQAASPDFACGFKRGYADYLEGGGDGSSHLLPPVRYWQIRNDSPEGRTATALWQAGFHEGAIAARQSGLREMIVVPVGDPGTLVSPPVGPVPAPGPADGPSLDPAPPAPPAPATPAMPELPLPQMLPSVPPVKEQKRIPPPPPKTAPSPLSVRPIDEGPTLETETMAAPLRPSASATEELPRVVSGRVAEGAPRQDGLPVIHNGGQRDRPVGGAASVDWSRLPRNADMLFQVGLTMLKAGNPKDGLRWLNLALAVDPDHASTHEYLASYYQSRGDFFQAAEHRVQAAGSVRQAAATVAAEPESDQEGPAE